MRHFELLTIGAGAGGLTVSKLAARGGTDGALVERGRPGGDCLWTGCIPSKAMIHSARLLHEARTSERFGVCATGLALDYGRVRDHIAGAQMAAGAPDSPDAIAQAGITLLQGEARFVDAHTLDVNGAHVTADRIVIATGSTPALPPIPGLADAGFDTNETIFSWEDLPASLCVLGGGPIGVELGQAMARFGVKTTLIEAADHLLSREDAAASSVVEHVLEREGVTLLLDATVERVAATPTGKRVILAAAGRRLEVEAERLLVATGRRPVLESLRLEAAGVSYSERGISVDRSLRTSQPHIFAIGDATGGYQFTHVAEAQGRLVAHNLRGSRLPRRPQKWSDRVVPRVTFSDPEVASVGLSEAQAQGAWPGVRTWTLPLSAVDRAIAMGASDGFLRVVSAPGWQRRVPGLRRLVGDEIVGATLVAPGAGDLLMPLVNAMKLRLPMGIVAWNMQAYPTMALGVRQVVGLPFSE